MIIIILTFGAQVFTFQAKKKTEESLGLNICFFLSLRA